MGHDTSHTEEARSRTTSPSSRSRSFTPASRPHGGGEIVDIVYLREFSDSFYGLSDDSPEDAFLVEDTDGFLMMTADPEGGDTAVLVKTDTFVEIQD